MANLGRLFFVGACLALAAFTLMAVPFADPVWTSGPRALFRVFDIRDEPTLVALVAVFSLLLTITLIRLAPATWLRTGPGSWLARGVETIRTSFRGPLAAY